MMLTAIEASLAAVLPTQNTGASLSANCTNWITSLGSQGRGMRTYSQGTQDGVLRLIFQRIRVTNARCVEFGFGYAGTKRGWDAIRDHPPGAEHTAAGAARLAADLLRRALRRRIDQCDVCRSHHRQHWLSLSSRRCAAHRRLRVDRRRFDRCVASFGPP